MVLAFFVIHLADWIGRRPVFLGALAAYTVQPAFVVAMHDALDQVDAAGGGAIVLTGSGKSFDTGLDVPVVMPRPSFTSDLRECRLRKQSHHQHVQPKRAGSSQLISRAFAFA